MKFGCPEKQCEFQVAERQSFRGHVKDLRPLFREEVKKMVPQLLDPHVLQPKTINGKPVTCRKMIQYLKEYVKAFDGHSLPEPQGILNANAKLLCMEAAHEAKVAYCRGMDRVKWVSKGKYKEISVDGNDENDAGEEASQSAYSAWNHGHQHF